MSSQPMRLLVLAILVSAPTLAYGYQESADLASSYSRAEALVHGRQWDQALSILVPLTTQFPENTRVLNLVGLAATGKGNIEEADRYFRAAIKINPGFVPALKNLGLNEFGMHHDRQAEEHLSLALQHSQHDPVIHLYLGELAYERREFPRAVQMLEGASDLVFEDPNRRGQLVVSKLEIGQKDKALELLGNAGPERLNAGTQLTLGLALMQSGFAGRAVTFMEAVWKSNPDASDVEFDLAVCHLSAKEYESAIAVANDLIARGHETSELNNLLAEAYEGHKQTQLAVNALRRAIALDSKSIENYLGFASLCLNHNAFDDGLKVLNAGLQVNPQSDRLIFERGILNAMKDHFELAEKDFELASAIAPDKNIGTIGLGIIYLEAGNSRKAAAVLQKRLLDQPEDANLLYLLGQALLRSGAAPGNATYVEAQHSLERSVQLNPGFSLAHVSLGTIYLDEERNADAVTQLEQARLADPNERSAYSHLAVAYRRLGEIEKAKEALTLLRQINDRARGAPATRMKEDGLSPLTPPTDPTTR